MNAVGVCVRKMQETSSTTGSGMRNILIVEDDIKVVALLQDEFQKRNMTLHHAGTIAGARARLSQPPSFDAVVLDLNLPDGDGFSLAGSRVCRESNVPVVMITARDTVEDRVAGLRHGADDYICKPFAVEELIARLEAVWRRTRPTKRHVLQYQDIELDLVKRTVRRGDMQVTLSNRELDLLLYFLSHPEEVLDKERIRREVWGDPADGDDNLLQVYTNYLRNKLEAGRFPRVIHTLRGKGYMLSRYEPKV